MVGLFHGNSENHMDDDLGRQPILGHLHMYIYIYVCICIYIYID